MNAHIRPRQGACTAPGQRLARYVPDLMARLRGPELDAIAARVQQAIDDQLPMESTQPTTTSANILIDLLALEGQRLLNALQETRENLAAFQQAIRRAQTPDIVRAVLLHHLRQSRSGSALREDIRALRSRWLNADAIAERHETVMEAQGVELEIIATILRRFDLTPQAVELLRRLMGHERLPTRRAATRTLAGWALSKVRAQGLKAIPGELLQALLRLARDPQNDPLCVRAALPIILELPQQDQKELLLDLLAQPEQAGRAPSPDDASLYVAHKRNDFLVRAEAARLSQRAEARLARSAYTTARRDPSETVRSALADGLAARGDVAALVQLERLAEEDQSQAVQRRARDHLARLRGLQGATGDGPDPLGSTPDQLPDDLFAGTLRGEAEHLAESLATLEKGQTSVVPLPSGCTPDQLAAALTHYVVRQHGFALKPLSGNRVRVTRGDQAQLRLWRMIFELRRPDSAKRQDGAHTLGRTMAGPLRVPSRHLAEVNPTGIPSQAVLSEAWDHWAPWLPLPEDYLDALGYADLRIASAEGCTTIRPPATPWSRLAAAFWAAWSIPTLDGLRLLALRSKDPLDRIAYVERLTAHGFQTVFTPATESAPPEIPAYFTHEAKAIPPWPGRRQEPESATWGLFSWVVWEPFASLVSGQHNRPGELALFCLALATAFLTRMALLRHRIDRARAKIPLVIGGWGTRGKSGTERLKAALFEGLGYDMACKTTGCEAMVLRRPPGGHALELFIYRPFERASIWEHADVLRRAAEMRAQVFLWECMALRPSYVEQLQLHWTRDDLSTITNAYPDHEDHQGPTGRDVAETIAKFIPEGSRLLTTEDQMLPILRDEARRRGTSFQATLPDEVEAIPADLLGRIPYAEHPANVALVMAMARDLGVDEEEALILMADYVVPDLGALATYPRLRHTGRIIEFTNGMSANERAGFLNNWRRTGFNQWSPLEQAGIFNVTVVNNRRDRVPRSRIFASILVNDAPAHRHILIGTNITGLRSFVIQALKDKLDRFRLLGGEAKDVRRRLTDVWYWLRITHVPSTLRACGAALQIPAPELEGVARSLERRLAAAPRRPLSLREARNRLAPIAEDLERLANKIGGVFHSDGSSGPGSALPHMVPPLFHDDEDLQQGTSSAAELWLQLAAEELAFRALWRCATGEFWNWDAVTGDGRPLVATPVLVMDEDEEEEPTWGETGSLALPHNQPSPGTSEAAALEQSARALLHDIYLARIQVIEDPAATGDRIIDAIARSCPAGSTIRCMGIQNIKGTGLDFAYRWVHAKLPTTWAQALFHADKAERLAALVQLQRWREWSIPCCQEVLRALAVMPDEPSHSEARADAIQFIRTELEKRQLALSRVANKGSWRQRLAQALWRFADPFDSVLRRWKADRIWDDLTTGRISHQRAAHELQILTQRQRGEVVEDKGDLLF